MLNLGYDKLHCNSHSLLFSSRYLAAGTGREPECTVEIKVSLPIAGSENACISRTCTTGPTCCAFWALHKAVPGLTMQCSFFLFIVNFLFVERQEKRYREAVFCATESSVLWEKHVLLMPFTQALPLIGTLQSATWFLGTVINSLFLHWIVFSWLVGWLFPGFSSVLLCPVILWRGG